MDRHLARSMDINYQRWLDLDKRGLTETALEATPLRQVFMAGTTHTGDFDT